MKTLPRTRLIVIATVGLASAVAIFVFAQPPPPATELKFKIVMHCADGKKADLLKALSSPSPDPSPDPLINHKDRFRLKHDDIEVGGGTAQWTSEPPCTHLTSNVTQHAAFANSKEMAAFLNTAFPTPTP